MKADKMIQISWIGERFVSLTFPVKAIPPHHLTMKKYRVAKSASTKRNMRF